MANGIESPAAPAPAGAPVTAADILPRTPDESAVPAASETVSETEVTLPDEVLEIPAMYGLLNGAPPAIYADMKRQDPQLKVLGDHAQELGQAGIGFYQSKDGQLGVLYNSAYVDEQQLQQADQAGKLTEVAAPYDEVTQSFNAAAGLPPAAGAPQGPANAPLQPTPTASGNPPTSKTQQKLATARVNNLNPGSPTSGPRPGAGRILNNIIKSAV